MFYIKKEEFIWELSKYGHISNIYKNIHYINHAYSNEHAETAPTSKVRYITLFPTFLTPTLVNEENYRLKKIIHKNLHGAGVVVKNHKTIESYLNKNLKSKFRKEYNRAINRLEHCFNISYVHYHGDITKETFDFITDALKNMLEKRFDQKNMVNHFLVNWENNVHNLFHLINQKKASMLFMMVPNPSTFL